MKFIIAFIVLSVLMIDSSNASTSEIDNNFEKGYTLFSQGNLKKAKQFLEEEIKLSDSRDAHEYYAYCILYSKEENQEITEVEKALKSLYKAIEKGSHEAREFLQSVDPTILQNKPEHESAILLQRAITQFVK